MELSPSFHREVPRGWGVTVLPDSKDTLSGSKEEKGVLSVLRKEEGPEDILG